MPSVWDLVATASGAYVPPTPGTGPSTPTYGGGIVTIIPPAPNGGGDWAAYNPPPPPTPGAVYDPHFITETVETLGGQYPATPAGGQTCVRCQPPVMPGRGVGTPAWGAGELTGTPAAETTVLAKLAGLPWWVWVLGLVAVASAFADRK